MHGQRNIKLRLYRQVCVQLDTFLTSGMCGVFLPEERVPSTHWTGEDHFVPEPVRML